MKHTNRRRYFPDPFNFILLFVVWLLLTHRFTFGNLLLAAILAWLIPLGVGRIRTATVPVKNH
jgi:multisubunit Na+/H+ antiporter MnhE subunit